MDLSAPLFFYLVAMFGVKREYLQVSAASLFLQDDHIDRIYQLICTNLTHSVNGLHSLFAFILHTQDGT